MRGAAAPRTPRLKRKDTLHAYRVAANATDCESGFCQLVIAHERSAKVGICKTAPAKNGSIFL